MTRRRDGSARWRAVFVGVAALALLYTACGKGLPQNTFEPAGDRAAKAESLFLLVFWIATAVFVLVEGALLYTVIRFRRRRGDDAAPEQVHGNTKAEIIWTVIPALLLAGVAVPTVGTIFDFAEEPKGAMQITVIAHQWWWEVEYPDLGVVTANEMHIPTTEPVVLTLQSDELVGQPVNGETAIPVIHSFWVPRLSGKQDMVPGRTHLMTLNANEPGNYSGQCAEFCGLSHAFMRFRVIAQERPEFDEWVEAQKLPAAAPKGGTLAAEGAELFNAFSTPSGGGACIACHSFGTEQATTPDAKAQIAPDLTHFGSRGTFASGLFENDEENLRKWLDDPRAMKPGAFMPDYGLSEDQIDALVAYLGSLK